MDGTHVREVRNRYTTLTALFATLGSLTYGYSSCIIATTLGQPSFLSYIGLDTASNAADLSGAIQALYQIGGLSGALMSGMTSDKLGRRKAIFLAALFVIIGGALQAGSVHIGMFIVARFITGIGIGNLVTIVPVWQSEIAGPHSRGLLVGLHGTFILIGYSCASWLGVAFFYVNAGGAQWRVPLALQIVFPMILAAGIFSVPESPRWLIQKGCDEEAYAVCKKLRGNAADPDYLFAQTEVASSKYSSSIKAQYEHDKTLPSSWAAIFSVPSYRKRALIGFSCLFLAQCTGTQVINNYGPTIYSSLGYDAEQQLLLQAGWISFGIPANFIAALIMDRFGRVNMMVTGLFATGVALLGTTITVAVGTKSGNSSVLSAAIFFIFLHIATYGCGLDCPTYVYGSEIWPNHLRSKGAAVTTSGLFVSCLILLSAAPTAFANIGYHYYIVFVGMTALSTIYFYLFFPEVNGLSLEETGKKFGDHVENIQGFESEDGSVTKVVLIASVEKV